MKVAIVDGGSFVLPYDHQLAERLAAQGIEVGFFGSATRYNGEFIAAMAELPGAVVQTRAVSSTVASSRRRGAIAYLALLAALWRERKRYDAIDLQFGVSGLAELPFWAALALLHRRFIFTVHNPVPHGFTGRRHRPTGWLAGMADSLVFVSEFSRDDFMLRYGERFRARSHVLPHPPLPLAPGLPAAARRQPFRAEALVYWSTVKPYKGVEIFADLARSERLRQLGIGLEIVGAWSSLLASLRHEMVELGVEVVDRYLPADALQSLLARPVVFVLPYREASQSGALYTLLHHGAVFMCADVGDLGGFMRRHGLESMLLADRSAASVERCLQRFIDAPEAVIDAFDKARSACAAAAASAPYALAFGLAKPLRESAAA